MSLKVLARLLAAFSPAIFSTAHAADYQTYTDVPEHIQSYVASSIELEFPASIKSRENPVAFPRTKIGGANEIHFFSGEQEALQALYARLQAEFSPALGSAFIDCHGIEGDCGFYTPREFVRHPSRRSLYSRHGDIFNLNRHNYRMRAGRVVDKEETKFVILIHRAADELNEAWLVLDITHVASPGSGVESGYSKIAEDNQARDLRLHFLPNSSEITTEAAETARFMAEHINKHADVQHLLVGHADSSGEDPGNQDLARQRAEAVYHLLTHEMNVPAERLRLDAKGSTSPIAGNDSPNGRSLNRRVELVSVGEVLEVAESEISTGRGQSEPAAPAQDIVTVE